MSVKRRTDKTVTFPWHVIMFYLTVCWDQLDLVLVTEIIAMWNKLFLWYLLTANHQICDTTRFPVSCICPFCCKTSEELLCHACIPHRSSGDGEDSLWGSTFIISMHARAIWKDFQGKMNLSGKKTNKTSGDVYEAQESRQLPAPPLLYIHML